VIREDDDANPSRQLLVEWERRTRLNLKSHNMAERFYDRANLLCSMLAIGTLVGLGTAAASFNLTTGSGRATAISLSVLAAAATSLQAVAGYGGLAEAHRIAARRHAALSRRVERIALKGSREAIGADLDSLQREWDLISEAAPNVPPRLRSAAKRSGFPRHFV